MDEDILIPIAFFLAGVMIVLIAVGAAVINRFNLHETVREALRQGKTLDADAIKALGAPKKQGQDNDLKSGLILVAVAVGLVATPSRRKMMIPRLPSSLPVSRRYRASSDWSWPVSGFSRKDIPAGRPIEERNNTGSAP